MKYLKKERVKYIVVHCSATSPGQHVNAEVIDRWHRNRGWQMIGYHYVVLPDGTIEHGRPLYYEGAHVGKPKNYNPFSIGICYVGGIDAEGHTADTRTPQQKAALRQLIAELRSRYPRAAVVGHRDLDAGKACPCFDAMNEYLSDAAPV